MKRYLSRELQPLSVPGCNARSSYHRIRTTRITVCEKLASPYTNGSYRCIRITRSTVYEKLVALFPLKTGVAQLVH